jgi:hypothetical protein
MIILANRPSLTELRSVIAHVPRYPISAKSLVNVAQNTNASADTIEFFRGFRGYHVFEDADDLINRTEQLEIMHREEMPYEQLVAAEEY